MRNIVVFCLSMIVAAGALQGQSGEYVFHRLVSGPIRWDLTERGEVVPAVQTDLICKLRNDESGKQACTISWVIDDGSMVKKGELVAKFDDSKVKEMVEKQRLVVASKKADLIQAQEERTLQIGRAETDVATAELAHKLADLELQEAQEELLKARLAIKKRMAELVLEQAKREMASRIKQAEAKILPQENELQAAERRLQEVQSQLELCQLVAPHDGMAIFFVPESSRFSTTVSAIGVGEPVKEGQKVISVAALSRFQVVCKIHESVVNRVQPHSKAMVTIAGQDFQATVSAVSPVASSTDWMSSDVKVYTTRLTMEQEMKDGIRLKPGMTGNVVIHLAVREMALQIPVQAVREQRGRRFCYVKKGSGVERREISTGINNTQVMEVLRGLKAGEEVVMNPPRPNESKEPVKPVVPDPKPVGAIHLKSVKPEATARRSFVETYGLTTDDLVFVKSLSPGLVVPIRSFAAEIRNWNGENSFAGNWIASTAELGEWYRSVGAIREGRFLCDIDSAEHANVAVLGSNVANKLFPLGNALGQTIRLGGKARVWTVVGVMREQQGELASFNDAVIVHLAANRALHGDTVMVRSSGTRGMEAVQFSHILVQPGAGQSLKGMVQLLQARLETAHQRKDWEVVSSGVR